MNRGQLMRIIRGGSAAPPAPPVMVSPPEWSSPAARVGETISFSNGLWSPSPTAYAHGVDISDDGAGGWSSTVVSTSTFVPSSPFEAKYLRPKVRASLGGATSDWAYGEVIGPVQAADSGAGGTDYPFAPMLDAVTLYRTPLVPAGDERIVLQDEVARPYSPTVTSWGLGGADAAYFDLADGVLTFNSALRASIPKGTALNITISASNAFGSAEAAAVKVQIPADANCRFCDFDAGSDSNNGTTPALAWKQIPRSVGFAGTQVTLGGGVVVFFRGGVHHRYHLLSALSPSFSALNHAGTSSEAPFVLCGSGWGTPAILDGSDIVTGWEPVTEEEVGGNPNWTNITKVDLTSQGGAVAYDQMLLVGDDLHYPAQWPKPVNRQLFEGADDPTGAQGMRQVTISSSPGVSPRMSRADNVLTIVDPWLQTVIGDRDITSMRGNYWRQSNFIQTGNVLSWDYETSTLTMEAPAALVAGSVGAYSLTHDPIQISAAGQYALSADRTTLYAWRSSDGVASIARRKRCYQPNSHHVFTGFIGQMFTTAGDTIGGFFLNHGSSGALGSFHGYNLLVRYNRSEFGNGVLHGSGSGAWGDALIERITLKENPKCSGFRIGNQFNGVFRRNFIDRYAVSGTALLLGPSEGAHLYDNVFRGLITVHGNGFSPYTSGATEECKNFIFENNLFDGVMRPVTTSINATRQDIPRNNTYRRNILLGTKTGYSGLWTGEPDSLFEENIIMGDDAFSYAYTFMLGIGNRVTVQRNVIGGVTTSGTLEDMGYTVTDNLMTVNTLPVDDGPTRIVADNTVSTETVGTAWPREITDEMAATLGPGDIGVFWSVAA